MNEFASLLQPPDMYLPGLNSGTHVLNLAANRVVEAGTGKFVSRLIPTNSAVNAMSQLPFNPDAARIAIEQSTSLAQIRPVLQAMQLASNVAAIASVANMGISCVGFALVLHKLSRIEGKLDEALSRLRALQQAVQALHSHVEALSVGRIRAAADTLDRALHAESEGSRHELAVRARELFQEGRQLYLELWRRADPMLQPDVPVLTALEMQSRYAACAVGEIQAEFIAGDLGAFKHACASAEHAMRETMGFDAEDAFCRRADAACTKEPPDIAMFLGEAQSLAEQIILSWKMIEVTSARFAGYADDAELVKTLAIAPHELVRQMQALPGNAIYFLPAVQAT